VNETTKYNKTQVNSKSSEVGMFEVNSSKDPTETVSPPPPHLTRGREQILFPESCVSSYLELQTADKFLKASDSDPAEVRG
jgi:hypothetical protein